MSKPPTIHLAHPADGLPVCATSRPGATTTDPAAATCARCLAA